MDKDPHGWRAPKPQALPELRRRLLMALDTPDSLTAMTQVIEDGGHILSSRKVPAREAAEWALAMEQNRLRRARLFSVDEDMTDVAMAAARKLSSFEVRAESQPSPYGFMVFNKPLEYLEDTAVDIGTSAVVAASWGVMGTPEGGTGTWMTFWSTVDHEARIKWLCEKSRHLTRRQAEQMEYATTSDLATCDEAWFEHGARELDASKIEPHSVAALGQIVRSAWAMCTAQSKRKIAIVEQVQVPRPARRQAEREGYAHTSEVDVIRIHPRLRQRAARKHTTGTQETGYKIDYRKFVGAHTRWQPYPSRNTVELIMIDDYVQGPPGAPFRRREKVYLLDRTPDAPKVNPLIRQP